MTSCLLTNNGINRLIACNFKHIITIFTFNNLVPIDEYFLDTFQSLQTDLDRNSSTRFSVAESSVKFFSDSHFAQPVRKVLSILTSLVLTLADRQAVSYLIINLLILILTLQPLIRSVSWVKSDSALKLFVR